MKDVSEKLLKKYRNRKCPDCKANIKTKIVQKQVVGICQNIDCKKFWIFYKDKSGKENFIETLEVNGLLEFYVELPFNLSIPTGLYTFDKPKQIMLRRDMYYFQKGDELEDFQKFQPIYAPQDKVFNEYGLIKEEFEDYKFKRKMKSVLFKRYPMKSLINKKITIEQLIENGFFNSYIYKIQNQFQCHPNSLQTYLCEFVFLVYKIEYLLFDFYIISL